MGVLSCVECSLARDRASIASRQAKEKDPNTKRSEQEKEKKRRNTIGYELGMYRLLTKSEMLRSPWHKVVHDKLYTNRTNDVSNAEGVSCIEKEVKSIIN